MNVNQHVQRGMTTGSLINLLIVLGVIAWLAIKIVPIYIENGKVAGALENITKQPEAGKQSKSDVKAGLLRRFGVDNVTVINAANFDELVHYENVGEGFTLKVSYDSEAALFGNFYLLVKFDRTIEVH